MTGFFMKRNTGLKQVNIVIVKKRNDFTWPKNPQKYFSLVYRKISTPGQFS